MGILFLALFIVFLLGTGAIALLVCRSLENDDENS